METWVDKHDRLRQSPRLRAIDERIGRLQAGEGRAPDRILRALRLLVLDATIEGDVFALEQAVQGLRAVGQSIAAEAQDAESWRLAGQVEGLREHALLALERVPPLAELAAYEPESQSASFLRYVGEHPGASSGDVQAQLGCAEERVSVVGRELVQRGLLRKRKVGRRNAWDLTPRGAQAVQLIDAGGAARPQREHRLPAR